MSQKKYGHAWSSDQDTIYEQEIGEKSADILRQKYEGISSPIKKISEETGIAPDTIKKWYTGRKPPRLGHFLILVQKYPAILQVLLETTGHGYLTAYIQPQQAQLEKIGMAWRAAKLRSETNENVPINVAINSLPANLNERQVWFMTELASHVGVAARDIVRYWNVKNKTGQRDITDLKQRGLIRFEGANKTGRYVLRN
jgi:hypothetical protein